MSDWQQMLDADVLTLGMAADEARRAALGNVVTYLRVHEFASTDGWTVPESAAEVRCYTLPADFEEALRAVRTMRTAAGTRRVVAFSFADLAGRGWTDPASLKALAEAGLDDVAALPVDRIEDLGAAIAALARAGIQAQRITVSHPITGDRVALIQRVQRAMEAHPSIRRYAPLPRVAPIDKPTTGYDDVRMVAIARLALPGRSIEVDWQLYGPKLAQVALTFGADHLDAVAATDDVSLGPRRATVEDVERNISAAGFEPQQWRPAK